MAHGWMDVSASFQFMVDCLQGDWHVIACDWRGFGLTENSGTDSYWFLDYVGDLDAILQHYSPNEAVNLLGHSMGANVSMIYAGVRPQRIRKLVNFEGFGMPLTRPEQAPGRYLKWLDELQATPRMRRRMSPPACRKPIRALAMRARHSCRDIGRRKIRKGSGKSWAIRCTS